MIYLENMELISLEYLKWLVVRMILVMLMISQSLLYHRYYILGFDFIKKGVSSFVWPVNVGDRVNIIVGSIIVLEEGHI